MKCRPGFLSRVINLISPAELSAYDKFCVLKHACFQNVFGPQMNKSVDP